jgi:acyl CoA:acetate/3-ketoacid CoA transferase alpha subunit
MSEFMFLAAAVEANAGDGDAVAMEGFTHLIPRGRSPMWSTRKRGRA